MAYQLPLNLPSIEIVRAKSGTYAVQEVPSSDGSKSYRVDLTNQRCSCPAWKFAKGHSKTCKHLKAFGFRDLVELSKTHEVLL